MQIGVWASIAPCGRAMPGYLRMPVEESLGGLQMQTGLHLGALAACGQNGVDLALICAECMLMHFNCKNSFEWWVPYICACHRGLCIQLVKQPLSLFQGL